ncbi:helix-turn-helix transcriptional regulator [Rhodobacter sp. SGA-6-6]|uniref:helix-turn-helix transcriptional regulator n=1 Tax=Rhodobacter sp. SGA-6-6 TaxID=2710882 RepID=UPI0013ED4ECB|nr:helix-turn-helix domain-containing protein [Rhodobacter sp. SGA-6-6]NGM47923.1 helix-turn-helix transcriptional regulator [Rhodobacter sp. SGA-6-6]
MPHFKLDTTALDPQHRVAEFEAACAQVCQLMIAPTGEDFASRTEIALIGQAVFANTRHSACVTSRTMALAAGTGDNILLHIPFSGGFTIRQRGGSEQACGAGSIYVDPTGEPGVARFEGAGAHAFYLSLPRALLGPAGDRLGLRGQIALTPQWRLMLGYARAIHAEAALLPAADLEQCGAHLQDLVLLAIGADRDAEQIARGRGARVARLRAIRADIERNLTSPDLAPGWIAARHGISPRYLRGLFADEGTSFSDHVMRRRLMLAHGRLSDPALFGVPVSRIAAETGFGDLSWFNQRFRQAFGRTPTGIRNLAIGRLRDGPGSA